MILLDPRHTELVRGDSLAPGDLVGALEDRDGLAIWLGNESGNKKSVFALRIQDAKNPYVQVIESFRASMGNYVRIAKPTYKVQLLRYPSTIGTISNSVEIGSSGLRMMIPIPNHSLTEISPHDFKCSPTSNDRGWSARTRKWRLLARFDNSIPWDQAEALIDIDDTADA